MLDRDGVTCGDHARFHRRFQVGFVVRATRHPGHETLRYVLPNKRDPPCLSLSHIETQIDLRKASKAGPSHAPNPCVQKVERNEAQVGAPIEQVELRTRRTQIIQPLRRNFIGEQTQIPPLRSEKGTRHKATLGSLSRSVEPHYAGTDSGTDTDTGTGAGPRPGTGTGPAADLPSPREPGPFRSVRDVWVVHPQARRTGWVLGRRLSAWAGALAAQGRGDLFEPQVQGHTMGPSPQTKTRGWDAAALSGRAGSETATDHSPGDWNRHGPRNLSTSPSRGPAR